MATSKHTPTSIRVAQTDEENNLAHVLAAVSSLGRGVEDLSDEQLIELAEEPEFLMYRTPLERELIARLGANIEMVSVGN